MGRYLIKGLKALVYALACTAILLLLYASQLPQYGDGAIGTMIIMMVSFAAYVVMLVLALPLAVRAFRRRETLAQSAWLCGSIVAPLVAWLLLIWWTGAI